MQPKSTRYQIAVLAMEPLDAAVDRGEDDVHPQTCTETSVTRSTISQRKISVDHIRIECSAKLEDVKATLEKLVPQLDPSIAEMLRNRDREKVEWLQDHGPKLFLFLIRNHGSLLEIVGRPRKAYQYEIGNQITASRMTRHDIRSALYAPLRIVLYEDDRGLAIFEYDRPSSLFGQFADDRVTEVGLELDETLKGVLLRAGDAIG
jgi:hypothetical protein